MVLVLVLVLGLGLGLGERRLSRGLKALSPLIELVLMGLLDWGASSSLCGYTS